VLNPDAPPDPVTVTSTPAAASAPAAARSTDLPPRQATDPAGPRGPGQATPGSPANGHGDSALVELITFPVRVTRGLVHDVAVTARQPEAVAYWGGLAALAVVGVLEWPVAAAAGLGVAVAGAVRRGKGRGEGRGRG
jgi:hypothetical protein